MISKLAEAEWTTGRVGMLYRDMIPGHAFAGSHIRVPQAGPVPDYVHFHKVGFQMIYCYKGQVRVAYEDQGPPIVMHEGDCVLQPPQIRHQVLECSPLEVIELATPAGHETCADEEMTLPTPNVNPGREWDGQRFVHHVAASAEWQPWRIEGFEARDTGIGTATKGLAGARVVRVTSNPVAQVHTVDAAFLFLFVLQGTLTLDAQSLSAGDCFVMPAGQPHALANCSDDLELLEVSWPATFATNPH